LRAIERYLVLLLLNAASINAYQTIHIHYTGIVDINNEMRSILGRSPNAASTKFGSSCKFIHHVLQGQLDGQANKSEVIHVTFETGVPRFKALEQALFVGSGRFILDDNGLSAEYRISQVCKGEGVVAEPAAQEPPSQEAESASA